MKQPIKLQEYTITDARIEIAVRLLLIADLHSSKFGDDQAELLDLVKQTAPDVILFSGDLFDDRLHHQNKEVTKTGPISGPVLCSTLCGSCRSHGISPTAPVVDMNSVKRRLDCGTHQRRRGPSNSESFDLTITQS